MVTHHSCSVCGNELRELVVSDGKYREVNIHVAYDSNPKDLFLHVCPMCGNVEAFYVEEESESLVDTDDLSNEAPFITLKYVHQLIQESSEGPEPYSEMAFAKIMTQMSMIEDYEIRHQKMDMVLCAFLDHLGYSEGARTFLNTQKWYA